MSTYVPWGERDGSQDEGALRFKMVVVGQSGVGKTSLALRFVDRCFEKKSSTIGVEFFLSRFVAGDMRVLLQVWDTAGQERYSAVSDAYLRGAHTAMIVIDLSDVKSLEKVKERRSKIKELAPKCVCMLVGNKADKVVGEKDILGGVDLRALADEIECKAGYIAVSALSEENVDAAFVGLTTKALRYRSKTREEVPQATDVVKISAPPPQAGLKGCC
jgi:small GTP-binding protein